jgi:hypothetical protein
MGTHRKPFLHDLTTVVTLLCGKVGVHSNHLMSSTCSIGTENVEERAPTGVENGFCKMMVLNHVEDMHILNDDPSIAKRILLGDLEMVIATSPLDLQVRLGDTPGGLPSPVTADLTPGQLALFASQGLVRGAIEPWVRNGMPFAIGKKHLEAYIDPDIAMRTGTGKMLGLWGNLTGNTRIPMPSARWTR